MTDIMSAGVPTDGRKKRLAVFASGSGTNFQAIADACARGSIEAQVVLMVCDRPGAGVCERAALAGCEQFVFRPKDYASKAEYETEIVTLLKRLEVDLICLAGYMRLLSDVMLSEYEGRIINIHPSLLPAFKGAHAIRQAFEYGVKVYGVSIHYVDNTMDGGRIIAQKAFEYDGGDIREVERRIHEIEHVLYVDTIRKLLVEI